MMTKEEAIKILNDVYDEQSKDYLYNLTEYSGKDRDVVIERLFLDMMIRFKKDSVHKLEPKIWRNKPVEIFEALTGMTMSIPKKKSSKVTKDDVKKILKIYRKLEGAEDFYALGGTLEHCTTRVYNEFKALKK